MSFEGRYQKLCPNSHYIEEDVYVDSQKCDICGEKWERVNLVDDTNESGWGYDYEMESKKAVDDLISEELTKLRTENERLK